MKESDTRTSEGRARRWVIVAALVGTTFLWTTHVSADAVGPPPSSCPDGSRGESCHGGDFCSPERCSDEIDCDGDEYCDTVRLCIDRIDCASGWTPPGEHYWNDTVEGHCAGGESECSTGSCQMVRVCISDWDADFTGRYGCGCRVAGPSALGGAALVALAIAATAALALRRSRSGRS